MDYQSMCEHLAKIIKVPIREYDSNHRLRHVFGDFNAIPSSLEEDSHALEMYDELNKMTLPVAFSDKNFLFTAVLYVEKLSCYFIFGRVKVPHADQIIQRHSYADLETICEAVSLFYDYLYDQKISIFDILSSSMDESSIQAEISKKLGETAFQYQEMGELHNPYDQEQREQASIREGNHDKLMLSFQESYAGRVASLSKDELRSIKNLGIVVLAISTRSAIEGGVHSEQAFLLSDSYILKVDEAKTQNEVYNIVRGAEIYFTKLVSETKEIKVENPLVFRTKNLILKKMHEKIVAEEMARELNTTPAYLSTIFKKETGMTIHEFVVEEKLKMAENLLLYSTYTIDEIANFLAFSSQSHFGNVFKRKYQITPNKFRLKNGIKKGQNEY